VDITIEVTTSNNYASSYEYTDVEAFGYNDVLNSYEVRYRAVFEEAELEDKYVVAGYSADRVVSYAITRNLADVLAEHEKVNDDEPEELSAGFFTS
jgi:hypothetical protein